MIMNNIKRFCGYYFKNIVLNIKREKTAFIVCFITAVIGIIAGVCVGIKIEELNCISFTSICLKEYSAIWCFIKTTFLLILSLALILLCGSNRFLTFASLLIIGYTNYRLALFISYCIKISIWNGLLNLIMFYLPIMILFFFAQSYLLVIIRELNRCCKGFSYTKNSLINIAWQVLYISIFSAIYLFIFVVIIPFIISTLFF